MRKANWVVELADGSRVLGKSIKSSAGKMVMEEVGGELVMAEGAKVRGVTAGN